ncbi:MAG: nuclear transport factor 2 family protein [Myxococcota bacterium]
MNLDPIIAELEIRRVLARYCRAVDRGDVAALKSVYHPDATDDHGMFVGSGWDFAEALVPAMDGGTLNSQHHVTNVLIEIDEDGTSARVESYVVALHPTRDRHSGVEVHNLAGARYLDRFEKRDGAWKIADRRVVIDWTRAGAPAEEWGAWKDTGLHGGRREQDPSHGFFTAEDGADGGG